MISIIEDGALRIVGAEKAIQNGLFQAYGAITFPYELHSCLDGCAIMGLKRIDNGEILVVDVKRFTLLEPLIRDNSLIEDGLTTFLLENYLHYKCNRLFYYDDRDVSRKFRVDASTCDVLLPKPQFKRLKQLDLTSVFTRIAQRRLKYKSNGAVENALHHYETQLEKSKDYIVIKTLGALCYGFDRYFK